MSYFEEYDLKKNVRKEQEQHREILLRARLRESNYPARYDDLNLSDYPNNAKSVKAFFTKKHKYEHIVFTGKDSEKKLLALAAFKRYLSNYPQCVGQVISFPELYSAITRSWTDTEALKQLGSLKQCDLLLILDCALPINKDNNNTLRLIELFQYRQNFNKLMFITTETPKETLLNYYRVDSQLFISLAYKSE